MQSAIKKYGLTLMPFENHPGWFRSEDCYRGIDPRDDHGRFEAQLNQRAVVADIHETQPLGTDLVFQGVHGRRSAEGMRIFLITNGSPLDIAREFKVGSHAAKQKGADIVEKVHAALAALYAVAPFTPTYVDSAGYHARFVQPLTQDMADKFLEVYRAHEAPGCEPEAWKDQDDEGNWSFSPDKLVREQMFMLWWE